VWRGDSHGRVEAMEWVESNGEDYIFGLGGNTALDALVAETADNLRFHHAKRNQAKLHLYELHVPGELDAAAQSGGATGMLVAAGRGRRRRNRHAPAGRHPLRRHLAQGLGAAPL
jgi:hypothetical protein